MRMRNTFASRARLNIRQKFEHGAGMCLGGTAAPPLSGCDKKRAPLGLQTLITPHMRDQGWSSAPASSDTAEQLQKDSTAQYCVQYENALMFPSRSAHQNALSARPPSQISPQCRSHVLRQAEVRTSYCRICLWRRKTPAPLPPRDADPSFGTSSGPRRCSSPLGVKIAIRLLLCALTFLQ